MVLDLRCIPVHNAVMRKRAKIALGVLVAAVLVVMGWQVFRPQEREPVYQGKPLSVWLQECRADYRGPAHDAVRQIGTNAIPTLLKMLTKKDSLVVSKLSDLWDRHIQDSPHLPGWFRHPSWYENRAWCLRGEALLGFDILGANAQQAVPALIAIYERNISPDDKAKTGYSLNAIGPEAQRMAIPSYLRAAASPDAWVRWVALLALSEVRVEPRLVVPALAKSLGDPNLPGPVLAARALAEFGTNAQQAVPALLPLLSDPNVIVRSTATNALKAIDPEAAAKAGVK
jgi:HEAT repeat protein